MNKYKINYFLSLLLLSFVCCKSQRIKYDYENRSIVLNELEKKFDLEEKLNIFFESGFINEKIKVLIDSEEKYSDDITTDNIIGLAKYYSFKDLPKKNVKIILPDAVINLGITNVEDYKYVYINKKEKKYFVVISNKPHFYY